MQLQAEVSKVDDQTDCAPRPGFRHRQRERISNEHLQPASPNASDIAVGGRSWTLKDHR